MELWSAHRGAGKRVGIAMVRCDSIGLFMPVEMWIMVVEWLYATKELEAVQTRFNIINHKISKFAFWEQTRLNHHFEMMYARTDTDRDDYMDALVRADEHAFRLEGEIEQLIEDSWVKTTALGVPELHHAFMDCSSVVWFEAGEEEEEEEEEGDA